VREAAKQRVYEGPSEEIYDKSTQGKLKSIHSAVGYNAVAGSILIHLAVVAVKICEIQRDSLKNSN